MAFLVNYQSYQGASGEGILGKDPISLADNVFNTTATSLTLNGKGVINYGEVQQENFVRMLENFASATAPLNPTIGQLWFNASDYNVYVCVDVTNANVIAAGVTPIQVISGKGWVKASTLGGGGSSVSNATTTAAGIVELATTAEAQAGTDTVRAVTPAGLSAAITTTSIPTSSLGSGAANSTTFLRGDKTWATVGGGNADTLDGYHAASFSLTGHTHSDAGATVGANAVGAYGFTVTYQSRPTVGGTYSGQYGLSAGTWRCMASPGVFLFDGGSNQGTFYFNLWLRTA